LELRRQQAQTDVEKALIPPPQRPTFPHNLLNNRILDSGLIGKHSAAT
jgi:hypothetical protein